MPGGNNEQSEIGTKKRMSLSKLTRAMYIIKDLQNHKEFKASYGDSAYRQVNLVKESEVDNVTCHFIHVSVEVGPG